jgi:O-antigen/teichoic acid export membrane protein
VIALDQGVSSATNFATTLIAARLLGAKGLGEVALCLAVAFVGLALTRALVGEPTLIFGARSTGSGPLGLALNVGIVGCGLIGGIAFVGPPDFRNSLLALGVVFPFITLQDGARYVFFSEGRAWCALRSDLSWAAGQAAAIAVLYVSGASAAGVIFAWGLGAAAGAAYGLCALHALPSPSAGIAWLRKSGHLSGWLAVQVAISQAAAQLSLVIVAGLIGRTGLGALRAGQALFAPVPLAAGFLFVVALPHMRIERGKHAVARGVNMATALSAGAATIYAAIVIVGGGTLLGLVFGEGFHSYSTLLVPLGLATVAQALAMGPGLGIRSLRAGRAVAATQLAAVAAGLPAIIILALLAGVNGAAWGYSVQAIVLCATSWFAYRASARRHR